jgi:hypothetical protein
MSASPQEADPRLSSFHSPTFLARRLAFFATALLGVYVVLVVSAILPPRVLDPIWQLRFVSALLTQAAIPLVGLGLLFLASYIDPTNVVLERQVRRCARLSILAALGFFLLIPVQLAGVWGRVGQAVAAQNRDAVSNQARAEGFRRLISTAPSAAALQQALIAQKVQPLTPAQLALPLPELRRQLLSRLTGVEKQLESQPRGVQPRHWLALLQGVSGSLVVAMAYGLAFAAGAQGKDKEVSLLDQWLLNWQERRARLAEAIDERRVARSPVAPQQEPDYIETLRLAVGPGGSEVPAEQAIREARSADELEAIRRQLHLTPLTLEDRLKPLEQLKREMVAALADV